jgi:N-acetylmuramoyl-L-alanine amidase
LLISRHEISTFLRRIRILPPNIVKEKRVRIRRLLFVVAYFLSGAATPGYAALGEAPRCLPTTQGTLEIAAVNLPIPWLATPVPNYDAEERDYLIRTIAFEASGEPEEGKSAVAHVILNRTLSGRWGDSIKDVVTRPWQFEPWMTRRREMQTLSPTDPSYQSAARIADAVLEGEMPDPTAGATHFLNPVIVRQRRGGSLPSWAHGNAHPIGRHTFYSPDEGKAPQRAALLWWKADSISGLSRGPSLMQAERDDNQRCR